MAFWSDALRQRSETFVAEYIDEPRANAAAEGYLTIDLEAMRIADVRRGLTKFYGVVHSNIGVPFITGSREQFQFVSSARDIGQLDASHLDRVIVGPLRILNGVPYRGGSVRLEIGLFSIAATDLAGPYLKLLNSISAKAGISFLSAAQPFVELLHTAFQEIAGGDTLEIGRSAEFDPPKEGRYIIARATRKEFPNAKFAVSDDGRELLVDGRPVARPFIILRFSLSAVRKDWFLIPELANAYRVICTSARDQNLSELQTRVAAFRLIALTCPDLLPSHAKQLSSSVEKEFRSLSGRGSMRDIPRMTQPAPRVSISELKPLEAFDPFIGAGMP